MEQMCNTSRGDPDFIKKVEAQCGKTSGRFGVDVRCQRLLLAPETIGSS